MLRNAPTLGGGSLTDVTDDVLRVRARAIGIYSDTHERHLCWAQTHHCVI